MTERYDGGQAGRIEVALATLPPLQRAVFLALRDELISYTDLAERLGCRRHDVEQAFVEALVALDRMTAPREKGHPIGAILTRIVGALGLSRRRSGR